jgi:hypothetical protein
MTPDLVMAEKPKLFTEAGIRNLVAYAEVLRKIRTRLLAEGYVIKDGRLIKKDDKIQDDKTE